MDAYLQREDLPSFLKPAGSAIIYSNVDLSNRQTYKKENYKYHQYYENLSNNINSTGVKSTFFPDDSFSYYRTHKVYRPVGQSPNTQTSEETSKAFQEYDSFVDFPTLFSDYPLRGLSYHTAVDMPDGIYVFNGLEALHSEEYRDVLMKITNNFTIPPSNISMICDYDIPLPIDKEKILSMGLRLCRTVKKYLPDSKSFRFVTEMAEDVFENDLEYKHEEDTKNNDVHEKIGKFKKFTGVEDSDDLLVHRSSKINTDALKATLNRKSKSESNSSSIVQSLPKPLVSSAAARLSERYFLMYGGLEIQTSIKHPDPMHCVITKKLITNDQFWIFDTFTSKFREIKLSVHPTYSSVFPNSVPRFGHALTCSLEENSNQSSEIIQQSDKSLSKKKTFSELVVIYVMGGYKASVCDNSFVAMNDLWKCDMFLDSEETSEEAVASPIGNFTMVNGINSYIINKEGEILPNISNDVEFKGVMNHTKASSPWPRPRGYFPMEVIDEDFLSEYIQWRRNGNESMIFEENEENSTKIHSPIPTVKTKLNFSFLQSSINTKSSLEKEVINKTISRSSDYTQSSSSSTDLNASFSPTSGSTTNTSTLTTIKRKLLFILGGSTTLYTKYCDDENNEQHVFYNHDILNDVWIYDFKTERWYDLSKIVEFKPNLAICGHSIFIKNKTIKLMGGIEKSHYPMEFFEPIHADLHENCKHFKEAQKCISEFFAKMKPISNDSKDILCKGFNLLDKISSQYCSYFLYDLDFTSFEWKIVRLAFVRSLEYFGPWKYHPGCKILTGTVITKSVALQDVENSNGEFNEEFEIASKARLKSDHLIVITNGPIFFKDNKLILFCPDLKLMDAKTNQYIPSAQCLLGNTITEIYSTYF